MDDSFSSGIFDGDRASISFSGHFRRRSPDISEIAPNRGTPPELTFLSGHKDSTNVSNSTSLDRNQSTKTSSATSQYLSVEHKWPENENTYLIGDIKNWPKYRPMVDRSINFTALIEEKTIYEQSQTLRPYVFPSSPNQSKFTYMSIDGASTSRSNDSDGMISTKSMSSTMVSKSSENVDRPTHFMASKQISSGNYLKVPARAPLGDISSAIKNTQKPCAVKLPVLASQKWVNNLKPNTLNPVRNVHEGTKRGQGNITRTIVPACASLSVSKIPIAIDRQKTPIPSGRQSALNHLQLAPTNGNTNSQREPRYDVTHLIDKFPLRSNKSEVIWRCTPLRNSVTKSFLILNIMDTPLRLNIEVIGLDFRVPEKVLYLQANERRKMKVTFCPSAIGKVLGTILLKPVMDWRYTAEKQRELYLCAYGGAANCLFPGIHRAPNDGVLLNIEEIDNVTRKLISYKGFLCISNFEPVSGTAIIYVKPKMNTLAIHETQIFIEQRNLVVHQNEPRNVTIACCLRSKELEWFLNQSSDMVVIGSVMIILGSEPDRQRITAILAETNDTSMRKRYEFFMHGFPVTNAEEFDDYRGRVEQIEDLYDGFTIAEIPLVINREKLNETLNSSAYLTCMAGCEDFDLPRMNNEAE
ncbi:uncharacterized protein LOC129576897 [Sitodiplosis mosellana]|uniref:uncharacterized protein LOC129576897 n=1 Tax=Sitodiplosis mosellana TaxID=263140 RepID=UPI00244510A0|nr:uncharacterized protein LOC129576897 [Sitodiplosis mosellana]